MKSGKRCNRSYRSACGSSTDCLSHSRPDNAGLLTGPVSGLVRDNRGIPLRLVFKIAEPHPLLPERGHGLGLEGPLRRLRRATSAVSRIRGTIGSSVMSGRPKRNSALHMFGLNRSRKRLANSAKSH